MAIRQASKVHLGLQRVVLRLGGDKRNPIYAIPALEDPRVKRVEHERVSPPHEAAVFEVHSRRDVYGVLGVYAVIPDHATGVGRHESQ